MADEKTVKVEKYYLKPNVSHNVIIKGENKKLDKPGDSAELTEEQYGNFKDKFFTDTEYKAYQEQVALESKKASEEVVTTGDHPNRSQIASENKPAADALAEAEGSGADSEPTAKGGAADGKAADKK